MNLLSCDKKVSGLHPAFISFRLTKMKKWKPISSVTTGKQLFDNAPEEFQAVLLALLLAR
ncbi:hypothetical protein EN829_048250 [Mesorhizobium sp. M00.F.Ca.ET.186.01.1.1]|nr:hypothetical protein EN829_048250 [Mesorhizobium sp. M00.F.Ca.ET.186.01.1.1]